MSEHSALSENRFDLVIVGGGLSGALIAWRLKTRRPELNIRLIEKGDTLGGNHTWSFHETDLPRETLEWIKPLIAHRWARQEVRFPTHRRMLDTPYCSVESRDLHAAVAPTLGPETIVRGDVVALNASSVTLDDQRTLYADGVIDARGQRGFDQLILGYQKFVGAVFKFKKPHGLDAPIIMDATVPQIDGYRFVYVLPFTDNTALVEDTYYADGSVVDLDAKMQRLRSYCADQGWEIDSLLRTEQGVLPVAMGGNIEAHLAEGVEGVAAAGLRAGLFHPLTGYSLPDAAALADHISALDDLSGPSIEAFARSYAVKAWYNRGFYRMLSRFLFDAAEPNERYVVMQRFYKLNRPLIERFYAARSMPHDKLRVLAGKPPVNFFKAVACVSERQWTARTNAA